ncbi:MAG: DUF937 domain-containing protein [Epsilonproteobacteria bacterium]|nr:DUF937 domain-containing protein [Campylobacterota bacterium]
MDLTDLFKMGAEMIQGNSDDATTNLDTDSISNALNNIFGGENGLNLDSIISKISDSDLGEVVSSWIGSGENKSISMDAITDLIDSEKISEFASQLGLSEDSAKGALADALPNLVDKATSGEEGSLLDNMLDKVGGVDGAMDMIGKMFKS